MTFPLYSCNLCIHLKQWKARFVKVVRLGSFSQGKFSSHWIEKGQGNVWKDSKYWQLPRWGRDQCIGRGRSIENDHPNPTACQGRIFWSWTVLEKLLWRTRYSIKGIAWWNANAKNNRFDLPFHSSSAVGCHTHTHTNPLPSFVTPY